MTTPRYLPVATLKAWRRDETTANDDLITEAINAAETGIDNALKRKMIVVTAGAPGLSARVYAPMASEVLFIDDCTEVTAVVENGTTLTVGTDYQLEPLNGLSEAGESMPYYRIKRHGRCWYTDDGKATVSVTARWGWSAIPPQVVESCKVIADEMLRNPDMRFGLVDISEAGGVGSRENATVKKMIADYRYAVRTFGIA